MTHCKVNGCMANTDSHYGQPLCAQPFAGDPEAHRLSLRDCMFKSGRGETVTAEGLNPVHLQVRSLSPGPESPTYSAGHRDGLEAAANKAVKTIRAAIELLDYAADCDGICHVLRNKAEFRDLKKSVTALQSALSPSPAPAITEEGFEAWARLPLVNLNLATYPKKANQIGGRPIYRDPTTEIAAAAWCAGKTALRAIEQRHAVKP